MVIQKIRQTLLRLERLKRDTVGNQYAARGAIAAALGVSFGTVDNICRDRVKTVDAELAIKINDLHLKTIEAQIALFENERARLLRFNSTLVPRDLADVEDWLASARERLRKMAKET